MVVPMPVARSPELEFITRLARRRPLEADIARARRLADDRLDWARVVALAEHHGLVGLVHRSSTEHGVAVPSATASRLAADALAIAAGNLAKFARWQTLCTALDSHGIRALTLKGFHVAGAIYGDLGIRPVGDLDFLVSAADVEPSLQALGAQGDFVGRRWQAAIANVGLHYALPRTYEMQLGAADGLAVDLHWRAGPAGQSLPTDELLASAHRFTFQDAATWAPRLPDLLALLVAHGHKSRWHRFRWVVDVAEGLARLDADGHAQMRRHLGRLRLLPALALVERIIAESWSAADAQAALESDPSLRKIRTIHERTQDVYLTQDARRPLRLLRERISEHRNPWHALRVAATPSHRDWAALRLPAALRFGYYAVRPMRIARDAWALRHRRLDARAAAALPASSDTSATFVTAIYSSGPDSLLGGRGRGLPFYLPTLRNLASFGSPLVVFASQADVSEIRDALAPMFSRLEVIPFELSDFEHFAAFIRWKREYRAALPINDRNEILCFLKASWLASVSRRRPWGSARTYWIDAGLFHHGIFPERVGGVEQLVRAPAARYFPHDRRNIFTPALREGIVNATVPGRIFACGMPARHQLLPPQAIPSLLGLEADEAPGLLPDVHVVGGIFGGFDEDIQWFVGRFRELLARAIDGRVYTLEEQLFSLLQARHPERFALQRFGVWQFYAPGEPCGVLDVEGDSFYKVFTRLHAGGRPQ